MVSDDLFPLDSCLVLPTKRAHSGRVISIDFDVSDVLGVATVAPCFVVLTAWTPVDVHEAVVITSGNQLLRLGHLNDVDVGAISARWVNPVDVPAKLDSMARPLGRGRG